EARELLRGELVTVSEVRVSPDFNYAKIYVSIFPFSKGAETMAVLEKNVWLIRRELGRRIKDQLKGVPEIQFFLDDSLEYIDHIDKVMQKEE
ncbi:MAG: 30S ribosome-binding factor RbfA, partial [Alistipes sp.]